MKNHPLLLTGLGLLACTSLAHAAIVTFTIDPVLSSLTLAADIMGVPLLEQTAGSLFDAYNGTITGDLIAGTLTFTGSSVITAAANPAAPGSGFLPAGAGVENYAVTIPAGLGGGSIAFRDMVFDITSGSVLSGSPSSATFAFTAGHGDYDAAAFGVGSLDLTGEAPVANASGANATITVVGLTETLTIPISLTYTGDVNATFTGQLIATRTIPEPTSLVLGLAGLLSILRRRR